MQNFHFPRIIATLGPSLAKETMLSKVVNFVDIFMVNLSYGFDEMKRKYIDTILKLDNSKTIVMQVQGSEISLKNTKAVNAKKDKILIIDFSNNHEEDTETIFIDYDNISDIPVDTIITFDNKIRVKVIKNLEDYIEVTVINGGKIEPGATIDRGTYKPKTNFLSPKDKKDLMRGIQMGISMIYLTGVKKTQDIEEVKQFFHTQSNKELKYLVNIDLFLDTKIQEDLITLSDGVVVHKDDLESKEYKSGSQVIEICKKHAKPCYIHLFYRDELKKKPLIKKGGIDHYLKQGCDGYMLSDETAFGEDPYTNIFGLFEEVTIKYEAETKNTFSYTGSEDNQHVLEEILNGKNLETLEPPLKAIVCYSKSGYTAAKLSSIKPKIPIICFTKSSSTYRYINSLRGVKGYKISPSFPYENIKQIGKEMIRIIFKGNISLDDRIVIVDASGEIEENEQYIINNLKIYKFKNI